MDPFPAWWGKNSPHSHRFSRGGALHRKGERNSRVVPPFPQSPRSLSLFQGNLFSRHCLDFQADFRLTPRWRVGHPCGKASWESLVKASRESHRSLDPREGKGDTAATVRDKRALKCPQLEMRTDIPWETPEVLQYPCQHWRGILTFRHRLHTRS